MEGCLAALEAQYTPQQQQFQLRLEANGTTYSSMASPRARLAEDLKDTDTAILNQAFVKPLTEPLEVDHVHWVAGRCNPSSGYPRDVLCRGHLYSIKKEILQRA